MPDRRGTVCSRRPVKLHVCLSGCYWIADKVMVQRPFLKLCAENTSLTWGSLCMQTSPREAFPSQLLFCTSAPCWVNMFPDLENAFRLTLGINLTRILLPSETWISCDFQTSALVEAVPGKWACHFLCS